MNFQLAETALPIIKVLVVNPLARCSKMIIVKMLSGSVFGINQLIDVILLVYSNEKDVAEAFQLELITCALPCYHSIIISSELPSIADADVFCFVTNFENPNYLDFNNIDTEEHFDTFYLILKMAHNFARPSNTNIGNFDEVAFSKKKQTNQEKKRYKPIIVADGLVALNILMSVGQNIPYDILFCPTPYIAAAKSIMADHLKVKCDMINDVLVWAANDEVFHIEIEKPVVINDTVDNPTRCDWDAISDKQFYTAFVDHTQFSPSWMKKDLIEKVALNVAKNPYGCIYKAVEMSRVLRDIWISSRSGGKKTKSCHSMGVISDGTHETVKGHAYVLPIVFSGDTWTTYKQFVQDPLVRLKIKNINVTVAKHYNQLIPYCKKFLEENVINQAFVPTDDESESIYTTLEQSSRHT